MMAAITHHRPTRFARWTRMKRAKMCRFARRRRRFSGDALEGTDSSLVKVELIFSLVPVDRRNAVLASEVETFCCFCSSVFLGGFDQMTLNVENCIFSQFFLHHLSCEC